MTTCERVVLTVDEKKNLGIIFCVMHIKIFPTKLNYLTLTSVSVGNLLLPKLKITSSPIGGTFLPSKCGQEGGSSGSKSQIEA